MNTNTAGKHAVQHLIPMFFKSAPLSEDFPTYAYHEVRKTNKHKTNINKTNINIKQTNMFISFSFLKSKKGFGGSIYWRRNLWSCLCR